MVSEHQLQHWTLKKWADIIVLHDYVWKKLPQFVLSPDFVFCRIVHRSGKGELLWPQYGHLPSYMVGNVQVIV